MSTQHVIICLSLLFSYHSCSGCSQKRNSTLVHKVKRGGVERSERQLYDYNHTDYSYTPSITMQKLHRTHKRPVDTRPPQDIDDPKRGCECHIQCYRQSSCLDVTRAEGQPMPWYMRLWACCCRRK